MSPQKSTQSKPVRPSSDNIRAENSVEQRNSVDTTHSLDNFKPNLKRESKSVFDILKSVSAKRSSSKAFSTTDFKSRMLSEK